MGDAYAAFRSEPETLLASAMDAAVVTESDTTVLNVTRALWIGVTGNVTVRFPAVGYAASGSIVEFTNVPVGWFEVRVDQVRTATTASGIVAVW